MEWHNSIPSSSTVACNLCIISYMYSVPYGLYSTQFSLHTIMLIQLLLFYHRAHSFNSLLLRSKGNVQLVMYFSEVIRANSSKTSTALNKGTLGFVKAKCITKRRPLIYKNKQTKGRCIISKFIVQTTSYSWLQHILLILNVTPQRNVAPY